MPSTLSPTRKAKGGAPAKNGNRLTHGGRSLTMGSLPPGCDYIRRLCGSLRRQLERAVAELTGGEISLSDAATIQTTVRFERHAQLAQRWLREHPELPVEVKLTISRDIAKASAERDRCIKALGLTNRRSDNPWDSLHLPAPAPQNDADGEDDSDIVPAVPDAPESSVESLAHAENSPATEGGEACK